MKFVPKHQINNILALVQIMAWRLPREKPLSEPMMVSLLTHICVIQPQWVNNIPALVQIMVWRCSGDKPLSQPMMVSLTHICVTRPQWVQHHLYSICIKQASKQPTPTRTVWWQPSHPCLYHITLRQVNIWSQQSCPPSQHSASNSDGCQKAQITLLDKGQAGGKHIYSRHFHIQCNLRNISMLHSLLSFVVVW